MRERDRDGVCMNERIREWVCEEQSVRVWMRKCSIVSMCLCENVHKIR